MRILVRRMDMAARGAAPGRRAVARIVLVACVAVACQVPPVNHDRVEVHIPDSASLDVVADSLAAHGIVSSARSFRWFADWSKNADSIQTGVYYLARGLPMAEVMETLVSGPTLTLLEYSPRSTLIELRQQLRGALGIDPDSFDVAVRDSGLVALVEARVGTVEGYLYPTTYYVPHDVTARELVAEMVAAFERHWRPAWDERLDSLEMSRDELVTLASIVEGEVVRHEEDRPYVASVYHNRLNRGMRLQADPTVVYALGERRRLYNKDYRIVSEYNTYRIDGLPPGPITQPSTASIEAALYPTPTNFLFFVAGREGKHVFSTSYREHLATIRSIRRPRNSSAGTR